MVLSVTEENHSLASICRILRIVQAEFPIQSGPMSFGSFRYGVEPLSSQRLPPIAHSGGGMSDSLGVRVQCLMLSGSFCHGRVFQTLCRWHVSLFHCSLSLWQRPKAAFFFLGRRKRGYHRLVPWQLQQKLYYLLIHKHILKFFQVTFFKEQIFAKENVGTFKNILFLKWNIQN